MNNLKIEEYEELGLKGCFFRDGSDQRCSFQESSSIDPHVWLGIDNTGPHMKGPRGEFDEQVDARMFIDIDLAKFLRDKLDEFIGEGIQVPEDEQRHEDYENGEAWTRLNRTNYLVLAKRALCSMPAAWQTRFFEMVDQLEATLELPKSDVAGYTVRAYSEYCDWKEHEEEEPYVYCRDPLADYRHTGPLPLKEPNEEGGDS